MKTVRSIRCEEIPSLVGVCPENPRVVVGGTSAVPWASLDSLAFGVEKFRLHMLNAPLGLPDRPGITYEASFLGPGMRALTSRVRYIPSRLSLTPKLFRRRFPPDVVLVSTSAPVGGKVSLGVEVNVIPGAIDACRANGGIVVAQVNPRMPYTFGDSEYELDAFDAVVEQEGPLGARIATTAPGRVTSDVDPSGTETAAAHPTVGVAAAARSAPRADAAEAIGALVAERIRDGATLQVGIGDVPNAALRGLRSRRGLRIWSEMLSDGLLELILVGAVDDQAPVVASFASGSPELYTWLHRNPRVRMLRCETTNDPGRIATNPGMTSINTALEVDLADQANASWVRGRIFSGFGGQTDFTVGAIHASGGQAILALHSWHDKTDSSTIVPLLTTPVTSYQHSAVVTEQGVAELIGFDQADQAANLIDHAAAPAAREWLRDNAATLGIW